MEGPWISVRPQTLTARLLTADLFNGAKLLIRFVIPVVFSAEPEQQH